MRSTNVGDKPRTVETGNGIIGFRHPNRPVAGR